MSTEDLHNEGQEQEPITEAPKMGRSFRLFLFVCYLALLSLPYVYLSHRIENQVRTINDRQKKLQELRSEYITLKSEVREESRESRVANRLESTGLKPLDEPVQQIVIPKD